jgi:hypothetical protein
MANISAYLQKAMLDWVLGGATSTQPASRLAALSLGTPTTFSASEVLPNSSGYLRQTGYLVLPLSPRVRPATRFGPFLSSNAIQGGVVIFDTSAFTAGNMLWHGTLLTARTVLPNDTLVIPVGG